MFFFPSHSASCRKIKVVRFRIVKSCSGVSRKTCCEQGSKSGKPVSRVGVSGVVLFGGDSWMQFGFLFPAPLKDAGTRTGPGSGQDLSPALQAQRQAAAAWGREGKEGKEGIAARSGRRGFSRQLFATLQGAAEAAH